MPELKHLLDEGRYEEALRESEHLSDPASLFCRASAYLSLSKPQEALDLLVKNRDALYRAFPLKTMKSTFEIRFFLKQYEEAYDDLEDFENRPYVSQEVEEFLSSAPCLIRGTERKEQLAHAYSEEDIHRILSTSKDDYQILSLLDGLKDAPIAPFNDDIVALLTSDRHPSVRSFALLLLLGEGYSKPVTFRKANATVQLVPNLLLPPFTGPEFKEFKAYLSSFVNEPSVTSLAQKILDDAILADFPDVFLQKGEDPLLAAALCSLSLSYLRSDESLDSVYQEHHLQKEAVAAKAGEISALLASVPPLAL